MIKIQEINTHDVQDDPATNMNELFKAYDSHYGKKDNKDTANNIDIDSILLKTHDGRDIRLDSDEAFNIVLLYAQKCLNNHNSHDNMIGGGNPTKTPVNTNNKKVDTKAPGTRIIKRLIQRHLEHE